MLEITGFTSPTAENLRDIFLANLQQPTYVNRVSIKGADGSGNRSNRVQSLRITLPVGLVLCGTLNGNMMLTLDELSQCCLAPMRRVYCSACLSPLAEKPMEERVVYFSRMFALQAAKTAEEREETGESGLTSLRDELSDRLGEIPGIDVLSATIIVEELLDFFQALAATNRDNGADC